MRHLLLAALPAALLAAPAHAQEVVPLELVLLADASGSIPDSEHAFQRRGYAAALTSPEVLGAIEATGGVALTYVEWAAGTGVVVPWTLLRTESDARAFADELMTRPRIAAGRNRIGGALLDGLALIEGNDYQGIRRVIDFSGDSANNYSGPGIAASRDTVVAAGVTINALALACRSCDQPRPGVEEAYRTQVIGGPGAFVVTVEAAESFAETVTRKLVAEILIGSLD